MAVKKEGRKRKRKEFAPLIPTTGIIARMWPELFAVVRWSALSPLNLGIVWGVSFLPVATMMLWRGKAADSTRKSGSRREAPFSLQKHYFRLNLIYKSLCLK